MVCPKCNGSCRLKMTGAVCLDCSWRTNDRSKVKPKLTGIDRQFAEAEMDAMYEEEEEY